MQRPFILLGALVIAACSAGSGKGLDASGRPIGEQPDPSDLPTLENIQARVFTPICTQCHVGAAAPRGLRLDAANAYTDLVGVPSQEVGGLLRVEAFNPDDSYLVRKIEGTASVGARMPLGGPPLPAEDIALIRQWILEGAMNTPTSFTGQARVVSVSVQTGTIRLGFSRELDANTVHRGTVLLQCDPGEAQAGYEVAVAPSNPYAVLVRLPAGIDGQSCRLGLNTSETVQLLDVSGNTVEPFRMEFK